MMIKSSLLTISDETRKIKKFLHDGAKIIGVATQWKRPESGKLLQDGIGTIKSQAILEEAKAVKFGECC